MHENSYGILKRCKFVADIFEEELKSSKHGVLKGLDVGCGTGEKLTIPLAISFEGDWSLYAYDVDQSSLQRLEDRIESDNIENISVANDITEIVDHKYRIIILSEVLEHVEEPLTFLVEYIKLLEERGKIIVTVPNGYGYFEIANLIVGLMYWMKIIPLLSWIKRLFVKNQKDSAYTDTLATSPHINFFSFKDLRHLFGSAGLKIEKYDGRVFMCGYFISWLIDRSTALIRLNSYLGSKLPPSLVSGWMFVLKQSASKQHLRETEYRIGILRRGYLGLKRFVNAKRYGI